MLDILLLFYYDPDKARERAKIYTAYFYAFISVKISSPSFTSKKASFTN